MNSTPKAKAYWKFFTGVASVSNGEWNNFRSSDGLIIILAYILSLRPLAYVHSSILFTVTERIIVRPIEVTELSFGWEHKGGPSTQTS